MNDFFLQMLNNKKDKVEQFDNIYNGIYIPQRFRNAVLKHIILNCSKDIGSFSPALLFTIQGPKGNGKTFMVKTLCEYYSIEYIPISGADLCGNLEGDSVKKLISKYESACIKAKTSRNFYCIVIDDFHKSLAATNQNNMSRTTNSEVLVGKMMNLAENPYMHENRIPIILTANNLTTIYSPLTRNGRMEIFDWIPNDVEKYNIVFNIFKQYYPMMEYNTVKNLVEKYSKQDLAFFQALIQDIFFDNFNKIINEFHLQREKYHLDNITELVKDNLFTADDISNSLLFSFAEKRNEQIPKNFDEGEANGK